LPLEPRFWFLSSHLSQTTASFAF